MFAQRKLAAAQETHKTIRTRWLEALRSVFHVACLVQQGVHLGVAVPASIETRWRRLLRVEHTTQDIRIRQRARRPLQRVELEVAGQHVGVQRGELVGANVEFDAHIAKVLLDD